MKKIINGKKYNTETAESVAEWDNGLGYGDFGRCAETLYRKRTGEFFVHGRGGARTQYAERCGNNCWCGGEDITPMTEEEAREWCEGKTDADTYEAIFGEVAE